MTTETALLSLLLGVVLAGVVMIAVSTHKSAALLDEIADDLVGLRGQMTDHAIRLAERDLQARIAKELK